MDNLTAVIEKKVLALPAPQESKIVVNGVNFKVINTIPFDALAVAEQIIAINEDELPIPQYMFTRLGRGHCGGTWAISETMVLKVNEINNRASIDMDRFVDGECLEALQGLPLVPKLYAYSDCKQYMIVERIHGMQTGEVEHDIKHFTVKLGVSLIPKFWNWKKWINKVIEFNRGCIQRGWIPHDLHGENVMIDKRGNLTVVDYGLFRKIGEHCELSKWNYDGEVDRITSQVKRIARELGNNASEVRQYEPENPLTFEEFQPKKEKAIEEEAKELVKRYSLVAYMDMEDYFTTSTETNSSIDEIPSFLKVISKCVKEYDQGMNKLERKLHDKDDALDAMVMAHQIFGHPLLASMPRFREVRTAPQVVLVEEEAEEVAPRVYDFRGQPRIVLGQFDGLQSINKKLQGVWKGLKL